jgi:hypothetical protein
VTLVIDGATVDAPADYIEVDATCLAVGERVAIGPAPEDLMATVLKLLHSQRVTTFIHVECTLEVVKRPDGVYVHGHHTYFTNCRNDAPLAFLFEVVDGQLHIRGD